MDYQSGNTAVLGATTSIAGIAALPNTGDTPVLSYVAIAAVVTGIMLIGLQIGVWAYKRSNR